MKKVLWIFPILISCFGCSVFSTSPKHTFPIRSKYPRKVSKLISERQKKYASNINDLLREDEEIEWLSAFAMASAGKLNNSEYQNFRGEYIRYTHHETANQRRAIMLQFYSILRDVEQLGMKERNVYLSPINSKYFDAFATPLDKLDKNIGGGVLIEMSSGIERVLQGFSEVLIQAVYNVDTLGVNGLQISSKTKPEIMASIADSLRLQQKFNNVLASYFFEEYFFEPHSTLSSYMAYSELATWYAMTGVKYILAHEYSHVLLDHGSNTEVLRFGIDENSTKMASILVGNLNFNQEYAADSLAYELISQKAPEIHTPPIMMGLLWLETTQRVRERTYGFNVTSSHPPAELRIKRIEKLKQAKSTLKITQDMLLYAYNLLWDGFIGYLENTLKTD